MAEAALDTDALARWLGAALHAPVSIAAARPLKGGGIQENWTLDATIDGRSRALVLRKDAPATIEASRSRLEEYAIIARAHRAGVTVPEPLAACADPSVLGGPFAIMAKVAGVGLGPKVVKDLSDADRGPLTRRLAGELALIHAITPPDAALAMLGDPPADFARAEIALMRDWLDRLALLRPGLEWALRWCEANLPAQAETTLIHRDFRTGNYMVEDGRLTAILDWEFATWGDPLFDIGWFMAACWRFGRQDLEAGGIGRRADFYTAYQTASGRMVDDAAVRAYEVLTHVRWAVIALQQGGRHLSGREPSLELALTGRMADELELAALRMTAPARWSAFHG
jgi:aminoglycoside phosphotransferase (APT) family kinase protein